MATVFDLMRDGHSLTVTCLKCHHRRELRLETLAAHGHGNTDIWDLPFWCLTELAGNEGYELCGGRKVSFTSIPERAIRRAGLGRGDHDSLTEAQVKADPLAMCGRYASFTSPDEFFRFLRARGAIPNFPPTWNLAPTQQGLVVRRHPDTGERTMGALTWGLIPHFTKDIKAARKPINARAETAPLTGMFRGAYKARRCLVVADLFYEWVNLPDGKQPMAIARQDGQPLVFGGLWEGWRAPDGEVLRTYAIITTTANREMREIHERMPLVLEPDAWPLWLGEIDGNPDELTRPAPAGTLVMWPVSRAVNSVRNNTPELIDRIDDPNAPPPSGAPAGPNPA